MGHKGPPSFPAERIHCSFEDKLGTALFCSIIEVNDKVAVLKVKLVGI